MTAGMDAGGVNAVVTTNDGLAKDDAVRDAGAERPSVWNRQFRSLWLLLAFLVMMVVAIAVNGGYRWDRAVRFDEVFADPAGVGFDVRFFDGQKAEPVVAVHLAGSDATWGRVREVLDESSARWRRSGPLSTSEVHTDIPYAEIDAPTCKLIIGNGIMRVRYPDGRIVNVLNLRSAFDQLEQILKAGSLAAPK